MQPMALNVTLNQWYIYCKKVTHDASTVATVIHESHILRHSDIEEIGSVNNSILESWLSGGVT